MIPKQIMIVEDEQITARYLESIISKLGSEVLGLYDRAETLLEAIEKERPDMVMMDINIRGKMDGLELTSLIMKRYQVPVVFITAYCDTETLDRALELSPYGYIVKPFTEVEIGIAIKLAYQRYLENHPQESAEKLQKVQLSPYCWFDLEASTLLSKERPVHLNAKQLQLLKLLIRHRNLSVSQETIEQRLWPEKATSSSAVRTLVYSIRKIAPGIIIETYSKIGYTLRTVS